MSQPFGYDTLQLIALACEDLWTHGMVVSQGLLPLRHVEFALGTAESTAKVRNLGQDRGMCTWKALWESYLTIIMSGKTVDHH